jgi:AcrR family transcriptional regulator
MRDDEATAEAAKNDVAPVPLRRRKAHIRETNEAHLLACAEAVFAERGLEGASTAMIAERAGLPKANLHYYFPTKLALYRRVLEDLFEDWHRAADTFESSDDPVEAIGGYVRTKMELSRRRPLGSKVWASEIIHGAVHMQDILNERVKPWLETRGDRDRRLDCARLARACRRADADVHDLGDDAALRGFRCADPGVERQARAVAEGVRCLHGGGGQAGDSRVRGEVAVVKMALRYAQL